MISIWGQCTLIPRPPPSDCVDNDIKWGELRKAPLITCSLIPTPQALCKKLEKGMVAHIKMSIPAESAHYETDIHYVRPCGSQLLLTMVLQSL